MIQGLKIKQIHNEIWKNYDKVEVKVKVKGGKEYSFYTDSFGRQILQPQGPYPHFQDLRDVKLITVNGIKYKPLDTFWYEVPEDEFTVIAHDPNPRRCGYYEAKIKDGKLIHHNNCECFFQDALSDMSMGGDMSV